jgi:hypothetical protein
MMRLEPRLHIDAETAGLIESTTMPLLESPTVIVTDAYSFHCDTKIVGDEVHVRAANGEEMTASLTVCDVPSPDDFEWASIAKSRLKGSINDTIPATLALSIPELFASLAANDPEFCAAVPHPAINTAKTQPKLGLAQIVSLCMEGYAGRPALARRAVELVTDPATGRRQVGWFVDNARRNDRPGPNPAVPAAVFRTGHG